MKSAISIKTAVISVILAASVATAGFTMTGCGEVEPNNGKEIQQAVSAALEFLTNARECKNYSSVSELPDGSTCKYYADDNKIKVEYDKVYYIVSDDYHRYKISQADDMTWHKTTGASDTSTPSAWMYNIINGINNTSKASLWTDYDSKTKTLTATYDDGTTTIKLDDGELILTHNSDTGIAIHTINNVGTTTVTLPENIIDDTQI